MNKPSAHAVLDVLDAGHYRTPSGARVDIADAQRAAEGGTRLYTPADFRTLLSTSPSGPADSVEVRDATTQQATQQLCAVREVTLLNFASARNVGGGFLKGARAQEEDLCRSSGLYRALLTQPTYYDANRRQDSVLYTDHVIHSPRVPFLRLSSEHPMLDAPFFPSVITAPAPNTGAHLDKGRAREDIEPAFARRWRMVLAVAEAEGASTLVLGAWGCGAFRGEPELVARTAREALDERGAPFAHVVFAIPDRGKVGRRNSAAFAAALAC